MPPKTPPPQTPPPQPPLPQSPQYPESQPSVPPYVPPGRSGLDRPLACNKDEPCGISSTCGRNPPCDGLAPCGTDDYPCSKRSGYIVKRPYKYKNYKYKAETTDCTRPSLSPTPSKFYIRRKDSKGLLCDKPVCRDASCLPRGTCGNTGTCSIYPTPPTDQVCNKEFKPPLVLGYQPKPEVTKKSEPVVGLLPEDAPCRNCRCLLGPTISDFKCVSKMCTVRKGGKSYIGKPNSRTSPRTSKNMTSDAMKNFTTPKNNDSTATKPEQSSLRVAIDHLSNVVMQLSGRINTLKGSGSSTSVNSSTSNKCRRRTCKYYTSE